VKGLGVVQLMAFLSLKRQSVPLSRDVILMAVPDEEVGGKLGAEWMQTNHYAEIDPEFILDEGGFGSRDLFAPGKLVFGISVAEKKILWLKITAEGIAGHGSQPHDQNPNDRLLRALNRLLEEPMATASFTVLDTMKSRVGTLAANKFNNAIQHSTISITSLRSGVGDPPKVNVIPSLAEATIDCRVLPGTTKDQWMAEIRRRLGDAALKIDIVYEGDNPTITTQDSTFYRALESAVKRRHPDAIVTPMVVPYGTDANRFRLRGVKSYGFTPVIVPAQGVMSMHGDAEFLPVEAVGPAIQILFEALKETVAR
jgi:acetylornithine deacetylase/succinyl-diaminopimelate desuccinylase-like protein